MKRIFYGLLIALVLPGIAFAQAKAAPAAQAQSLILEFVDGSDLVVNVGDKVLKYGSGITDGDPLPLGSTIKTGSSTTAELKLRPNGTIIKVAKATTFQVQAVATTAQDKNSFALVAGKVRTIAAKGGQYDFKSQTAVCGVRGTDFAFSVEPGAREQLMVAKGLVQFQKIDEAGNILGDISVAAGEFADSFASSFEAAKYSEEQFAAEYGDMGFQKLLENEVPGNVEEAPAEAAAPEAAPAEPVVPAPAPAEVAPPPSPEAAAEAAGPAEAAAPEAAAAESAFSKWLREILGMEIGSVAINGKTWSKAVIQPNLSFGKVRLGLYLPIIYGSNLFDPQDWYHPGGNDEWSFGTQKDGTGKTLWERDWQAAAIDSAQDLALKIKYLEIGRQLEDPFFLKLGNVEDMTLGHGLIMRNYANDKDFPAVRRVGFNIGIDGGFLGLEALTNDLADLENGIYGARLYLRPFGGFKLAIGFSGIADINPLVSLGSSVASSKNNPWLVGAGLDLDLPVVQSSLFSMRLFADLAAETEYFQKTQVLAYEFIYNPNGALSLDSFNNYGFAGGLISRIAVVDLRLEYRYYRGLFQPSLFDSTYDRTRAVKALAYYDYIEKGASPKTATMGVYGEGGFSFLKDKLSLTLGYMWPFDQSIKLSDYSNDFAKYMKAQMAATTDEFHAKLVIKKGLIPIVDVAGAIYYDKRGLAKSIAAKEFKLLDPQTSFGGEIDIPVPKTPNLDVAVMFAAVPEYVNGVAVVDPTTHLPTMTPSITFETRFHF